MWVVAHDDMKERAEQAEKRIAELEEERDEALAAVSHMISSGLGAPSLMRQIWAEKYEHLLKLHSDICSASKEK